MTARRDGGFVSRPFLASPGNRGSGENERKGQCYAAPKREGYKLAGKMEIFRSDH
jgi:hypothetical protein